MNQYEDDPTIADHAELWRRIPPQWFVLDRNLGSMRPTSQAFQDHPNGTPMSVLLADVVRESGRGTTAALVGHKGFALAAITAGLCRQCSQKVARDPKPDEPAHGVVVGKKSDAVRRRLAREAQWVVPPG
ncbi:MAG: hypothetical protein FJ288_11380 [Planctomycetes bacterium]|nr:hypothetical protein [Planctomycetota bacterium]